MMTGGAGGSGSLGSGQRLRLVLGVKEGPVSTFDPPKLKIKVVHLMIIPTKENHVFRILRAVFDVITCSCR